MYPPPPFFFRVTSHWRLAVFGVLTLLVVGLLLSGISDGSPSIADTGIPDNEVASSVGEVGEVIDKLTKADELLSITATNDAKSLEVEDPWKKRIVDRQIARAEEELDKAYEYLNKDMPARAITHFKRAWTYARVAIRVAQPAGRGWPAWHWRR